MKTTCSQEVLAALFHSDRPLAVHETGVIGHSETAQAARLRDMQREGLVSGKTRSGKKFKEWEVTKKFTDNLIQPGLD